MIDGVTFKKLKKDEEALWNLRTLFEKRGFRKASVNKFEDYSLYMDNKSFLESDNIISFMDLDGKLLALKPDVTLSIVKNIPKSALSNSEKIYYVDEVYRLSRENREYKVLSQIGVELIGEDDGFSNIEIIDLALESLALIDVKYILDISHLGFISGLLKEAALAPSQKTKVLSEIRSKSTHTLKSLLTSYEIENEYIDKILKLCETQGKIGETLPKIKELISSTEMQEAYDELFQVFKVLEKLGSDGCVNLDFSVVGALDYYNGIVFKGYVDGVPKEILTGGRYDNLMSRMKSKSCALGFGICLSDLSVYGKSGSAPDFDYLILHTDDFNQASLLKTVKTLNHQGKSVRLERLDSFNDIKSKGFNFTFGKKFLFENDELKEAN